MSMQIRPLIINTLASCLLVACMVNNALAQDLGDLATMSDEEFLAELDRMDSLSIIDLIDSLLNFDGLEPSSQLSIRTAYTSKILSAGRNFGVQQFGLSGGLSYYHKSGIYTDVTGYYNSQFDPKYNLTSWSIGYIGTIKTRASYVLAYNHYFYASPEEEQIATDYRIENPEPSDFTNELNSSLYLNFKRFDTGLDYAITFGTTNAHKFRWSNSYRIVKDNFWFTDRLTISPTVSALFGNLSITSIKFPNLELQRQQILNSGVRLETLIFIRRRLIQDGLTREEADNAIYNFLISEGVIPAPPLVEENPFGIMHIDLSVPIIIRKGNFNFSFDYHYGFPISLPDEQTDLSPAGYFQIGLIYLINL